MWKEGKSDSTQFSHLNDRCREDTHRAIERTEQSAAIPFSRSLNIYGAPPPPHPAASERKRNIRGVCALVSIR